MPRRAQMRRSGPGRPAWIGGAHEPNRGNRARPGDGVNLPADRDFTTVAGFALSVLKHIPETGERFTHDGWKFEIVDMDGRKIDKLIAQPPRKGRSAAEAEKAG